MRLATLAIFLVAAMGHSFAQASPPSGEITAPMPEGPGKAIVQKACTMCHAVTVVTSKRASPKEWTSVVNQMVSRGADLTDDEIDTVISYLSKNYGPLDQQTTPSAAEGSPAAPATGTESSTVNVNKATAAELQAALDITKPEAEALVAYREKNGNYKTWQEVAAVPGVTPSKIDATQKRITF